MAENTKIEWTNHTTNLWWGCTKVHKGCDNCYAEHLSDNRYKNNLWGNYRPRKEVKSSFKDLAKFQKIAEKEGANKTVFVGSMMDIFEKPMPIVDHHGNYKPYHTDTLRDNLFNNISNGLYPNLVFLFLTKRPSNINKYIPESWKENGAPENTWFGTSPVDQKTFETLVPQLKKVNGNRFLSVEPQLGPINNVDLSEINWVIQGGESGPNKRPFNLEWADELLYICETFQTPYFFKQIDKIQTIPEEYLIRNTPNFQ